MKLVKPVTHFTSLYPLLQQTFQKQIQMASVKLYYVKKKIKYSSFFL